MAITCTATALADAAKCFCGMSQETKELIQLYLLCQVANGSAASGVTIGTTVSDPEIQTDATALAANANRLGYHIQNMSDTNNLYVKRGSGCTAVAGGYEYVLQPGEAQDDCTGGSMEDSRYNGIVTVAGTDLRYICTEIT